MTKPSRSIRPIIHVVDDDEAVRRSLSLLLRASGFEVAPHPSGESLLAALVDVPRDAVLCAIVDIRLEGGMDGLTLQERLTERPGPPVPVIVVSGHADVPLAVRAMRAGAVDFIEKPYRSDQILDAVERALDAAQRAMDGLASVDGAAARLALLTGREREVLDAMVAGQANKEIARDLGISPRTVEAHRAALMERLGVRSLAEALRIALAARMA